MSESSQTNPQASLSLRPLIRDFVEGKLSDGLHNTVRLKLREDKELASLYAAEIRNALDEGRIERPEVPPRSLPAAVQRSLGEPAGYPSPNFAQKIIDALARATQNLDYHKWGGRIQDWMERAGATGFEFDMVKAPLSRGTSEVRMKRFSDRGIMAVTEITGDGGVLTVTIRPTYDPSFLVMVVPLNDDSPVIIKEVTDAEFEEKVRFGELPNGKYIVSVEPAK